MNNQILLTNIQRFSLHDGPGIRTTVFLKGCSLRCPWCSNPENIISTPQEYIKDGLEGTYGIYYEPEELTTECLRDQPFYEGKLSTLDLWTITDAENIELLPGGVTFSGGEALLQMPVLVPVCEALHGSGVHIAVETCLFVSEENLSLALENIDFFYIDMKLLSTERCLDVEKGEIELYLNNLDIVMKSGVPVVIRVPVIGSYTDEPSNRTAVHDLIETSKETGGNILKIELIKEHNLGESKYKSLNINMDYHGVDDELMEKYKNELSDLGILTEVCKI